MNRVVLGFWLLSVALLGCEGSPADPDPPIVRIEGAVDSLLLGETLQLTARVVPMSGEATLVAAAWSSSDTTVATVDSVGGVVGVGVGAATIRAVFEGGADEVRVRVVRKPFPGWVQVVTTGSPGTCGLSVDGELWCWNSRAKTAVEVLPGTRFVTLDTGACAVTADGRVHCWDPARSRGADVLSLAGDYVAASGRFNAGCALGAGGTVVCWTGDGEPTVVPDAPQLASVSVGDGYACGLTREGVAYCWKVGSLSHPIHSARLGNGTLEARTSATPVATDMRFASIDAGATHACALTAEGDAYCWGDNTSHELGVRRGDTTNGCAIFGPPQTMYSSYYCVLPQRVSGGLKFKQIEAGRYQTCALSPEGKAYCWGSNIGLALGVEKPSDETCRIGAHYHCTPTPVEVRGELTFVSLGSSLQFHTCGITAARKALCWGYIGPDGLPVERSFFTGEATPVALPDPY